jgi:hypothetical protein
MMMTYEEMKAKKEKLEKDLAELNKEMSKHEEMVYRGKLNKAHSQTSILVNRSTSICSNINVSVVLPCVIGSLVCATEY